MNVAIASVLPNPSGRFHVVIEMSAGQLRVASGLTRGQADHAVAAINDAIESFFLDGLWHDARPR